MLADYDKYVGSDLDTELAPALPALRRMLRAVLDAVATLPEGQQVHPDWSPEFAESVKTYLREQRMFEQERMATITAK